MTHTHHRLGDRASLEEDYILLSMIDEKNEAQLNYKGPYDDRIRSVLNICGKHNAIGMSARSNGALTRLRYMKYWDDGMDSGIHKQTSMEKIQKAKNIGPLCHANFSGKKDLEAALRELKEADLGISIVISGVFDEVFDACKKTGLTPHTVLMSLGTWGKTELLPKSPVLEMCTMCGHGMISRYLVDKLLENVKKGLMKPEEAAVELGKQCTDNIFNTERAVKIIRKYFSP